MFNSSDVQTVFSGNIAEEWEPNVIPCVPVIKDFYAFIIR